jgi:hypothetical protein
MNEKQSAEMTRHQPLSWHSKKNQHSCASSQLQKLRSSKPGRKDNEPG